MVTDLKSSGLWSKKNTMELGLISMKGAESVQFCFLRNIAVQKVSLIGTAVFAIHPDIDISTHKLLSCIHVFKF